MTSRDELIRTTNGSVGEIANHLIFKKKMCDLLKKPLCYEIIRISVELSK